jgi:hypothetical protein
MEIFLTGNQEMPPNQCFIYACCEEGESNFFAQYAVLKPYMDAGKRPSITFRDFTPVHIEIKEKSKAGVSMALNAAHTPEAQDDPHQYLKFSALGKAILLGKDQEAIIDPAQNLHTKLSDLGPALKRLQHPGAGSQKVVLIDEIDKAPRDVPNDILNEIDDLAFQIPELDADAKNGQITVEKIVTERLGKRYTSNDKNFVQDAIDLFRHLREQELGYKPSLAELLNWLDFLLPKEGKSVELPKRLKDLPRERCLASVSQCLLKNEKSQRDLATLLENRFK